MRCYMSPTDPLTPHTRMAKRCRPHPFRLSSLSALIIGRQVISLEALDQGLRREAPPAELRELIAAFAEAEDYVQAELIVPE